MDAPSLGTAPVPDDGTRSYYGISCRGVGSGGNSAVPVTVVGSRPGCCVPSLHPSAVVTTPPVPVSMTLLPDGITSSTTDSSFRHWTTSRCTAHAIGPRLPDERCSVRYAASAVVFGTHAHIDALAAAMNTSIGVAVPDVTDSACCVVAVPATWLASGGDGAELITADVWQKILDARAERFGLWSEPVCFKPPGCFGRRDQYIARVELLRQLWRDDGGSVEAQMRAALAGQPPYILLCVGLRVAAVPEATGVNRGLREYFLDVPGEFATARGGALCRGVVRFRRSVWWLKCVCVCVCVCGCV